jgi:hypothetical protein
MRREWLLPMLEKGALGVPGSFDSVKGGKAKLGTGKKPSLSHNLLRGAAMKLAELSAKAFEALPVEQRNFWRDAAREAAATTGDDEESGDEDESDEEGR